MKARWSDPPGLFLRGTVKAERLKEAPPHRYKAEPQFTRDIRESCDDGEAIRSPINLSFLVFVKQRVGVLPNLCCYRPAPLWCMVYGIDPRLQTLTERGLWPPV